MRSTNLLLLLALSVVTSGCFYSREISHIRGDMEKALGVSLDREIVVSVGPRTFHTLGWLSRRVPNPWAQMAGDLTGEIDRVKVGVYHADSAPDASRLTLQAMPRFRDSGWQVAVRTRDESEAVWLLYRERHDSIRDMMVLSVDDRDVVITRIQGHLDALFEQAVADSAFLIDMSRTGRDAP
jgi:hypothetical protein